MSSLIARSGGLADKLWIEQPVTILERTHGALRLRFGLSAGRSVARETFQSGALRVRFPNVAGMIPEAVLINTAGGITGGDELDIALELDEGTAAVLTSQACEKIYKSTGADAQIASQISLAAGARLDWLPQPAILFNRSRLARHTKVEMADDASLLALEACIIGRTAMNEQVSEGYLTDRWRIRRGGTLIYADTLRIDDFGPALRAPWALGSFRAYANLIYVAPDAAARLENMREALSGVKGQAAASSWSGILAARFLAPDGYTLIADLLHALARFRAAPLPRLWSI